MAPQASYVNYATPSLQDDAFYAMIASHFPSLDTPPQEARRPDPTGGIAAPTVTASTSAPFQPANSLQQHVSSVAGPSTFGSRPYSSEICSGAEQHAHSNHAHRSTGSIYYPQPTRSGRVPVPPPEEELQAMLAMDNYFEFPSESESDDEDFVLPASEANEEEEDLEEYTPANETPNTTNMPGDRADDNETNDWNGTIDSTEYEWLMDNLKALDERTTPRNLPGPAEQEQNVLSSALALTTRSAQHSDIAPVFPPVTSASRTQRTPSSLNHCAVPETRTAQQAHADSDDTRVTPHARPEVLVANVIVGVGPELLEHARQGSDGERFSRQQNVRKRRTSALESNVDVSDDTSSRGAQGDKLCSHPAKLELKRKKNAEQSRAFRERQRAQREAVASRIDELQEENSDLRATVKRLEQRLNTLEGRETGTAMPTSRKPALRQPTKESKRARNDANHAKRKTTASTASKGGTVSIPSASQNSPKQEYPSALGNLSFEDLGKFMAGLMQAKAMSQSLQPSSSSSATAEAPSLPRRTSSGGLSSNKDGFTDTGNEQLGSTQSPLVALAHLLASRAE
jgi:hypothetical protein